MSEKNLNLCLECGNNNLISDDSRGEIICNKCGLVITQRIIDAGPEWRAFSSEEANRKVRVGAPTTLTLHDKGLSTMIGWKNKDAFGKVISPKMKAEVYRLRKWHVRT
ncbi:MAG: TFIIB-type zinc ribbon-containing protein, partial [Promethearchaeota archaeon]